MVALVGPNGAGKTTFLNLLTGQYLPDSGSVRFDGADVTRLRPSDPARAPVFRSYQGGGTFNKLSALENVAVAAVARGLSRREAERAATEALGDVGLGPVAHERAERLSGGQRKLVDFARSLVVRPKVALLDEPTAGVNPVISEVMTRVIRERQSAGMACLIISHDLAWVFDLCPWVVALAAGQLLAKGTPQEVRADPRVVEAYLA